MADEGNGNGSSPPSDPPPAAIIDVEARTVEEIADELEFIGRRIKVLTLRLRQIKT